MTPAADDRLLAPYRPVRRVTAGDGGPWSGLLVRLDSGDSRVLVDAGELPPDWVGWTALPEGHLLTPLDVVRRADGHAVMLPLCVERVSDFLMRREAARMPLSAGEAVTLGVSLVRGFASWDALGRGSGEWWLTDAGQPMLAAGSSALDAGVCTAELLRALAGQSPCSEELAPAIAAASSERVSAHDLRDAEDALFRLAVPEPLITTQHAPRAARELAAFDRRTAIVPDEQRGERGWAGGLARHVDADLADAISRTTTGLWRRMGARRDKSRRPLILAVGMAGAVLLAGLLWPTGAAGPATADTAVAPGEAAGAVTPAPDATPPADAPIDTAPETAEASADLVAVTDALLTARTTCGSAASCLAGVMVDPAADITAGAIDLEPAQRETVLLDDFGGMAVLRVAAIAGDHDTQLVVIMLHSDRWLLRDVHVAKQP